MDLKGSISAKPVLTPDMKEEVSNRDKGTVTAQEEDDEELSDEVISEYRALAARANHLAPHQVDVKFATLQLRKDIRKPTQQS